MPSLVFKVPPPRKPLQNIVWLVGERVGRAAVTVTVIGVIARYLEPTGFGRLNFAITVMTMAAALAYLGLDGLVVGKLVQQPAESGAVMGTAFRLRLGAGLATALLLGVFSLVAVPAADASLIAVVGLSLIFQAVEVVDLWFQRHLDSRRTVVARLCGIMAGATLKLWLVAHGAPLIAFAWAQAADAILIAAALAWSGKRSPYPTGRWTWSPQIARDFWRRGAPLALSSLMVAVALRLDQVMVRGWLGEHAAGIYFASIRLVDLANFAGSALALSLFPALAAAQPNDMPEYRARLQGLFDALSLLGWLVALACTFAGSWAVRLIYGPAYSDAGAVLAVQGWYCLFSLNAIGRWNFILLSASTALNLVAALLHIIVVAVCGIWLIPRHGVDGAAVALVGAAFVSGYASSFVIPSLRACGLMQTRGFLILFTPQRWPDLLRQFDRPPV